MGTKRRSWFFVVIAAAVLSLLSAACSSSGGSTASSSSASTSAAGGSSGSAGCKTPAGPTVDIMAILEEAPADQVSQPGSRAAIEARIHAINCAGGLGAAGDKLAVIYCISNFDPNQVNACANQPVSDKTVVPPSAAPLPHAP